MLPGEFHFLRPGWLLLLPVLIALIVLYSNTDRDLYPLNDQDPAIHDKGALP